jgi:hypothetical protein
MLVLQVGPLELEVLVADDVTIARWFSRATGALLWVAAVGRA